MQKKVSDAFLLDATGTVARIAKEEDLGSGDVTSQLLEAEGEARFELFLKQPAVFAGQAVAGEILNVYDEAIRIEWQVEPPGLPRRSFECHPPRAIHSAWAIEPDAGPDAKRGQQSSSAPGAPPSAEAATWMKMPDAVSPVEPAFQPVALDGTYFERTPVRLAILIGPNRSVLATERVLLNFLQRLCGVATLTRRYVDAVVGTTAKIYDTRKTTPGWRLLEKYAVRCGGGHNHRMGLYDAVLLKDNHLAGIPVERLSYAVFDMLNRAADLSPVPKFVEVEADSLEQLEELFKVVGIHIILLDNFGLDDLRRAVARRDALGLKGRVELEASGGITLANAAEVARTGVDRISVGALTHSATAVDLSLARL
ncbi:MAG: carboxylating nicotinate-nucleotide diphosphorylase [Planctomycetota bacterium]